MKFVSFPTDEIALAAATLKPAALPVYIAMMTTLATIGKPLPACKKTLAAALKVRPSTIEKHYEDLMQFFFNDGSYIWHWNINISQRFIEICSNSANFSEIQRNSVNPVFKSLKNNDNPAPRIEEKRIEENIKPITKVIVKKDENSIAEKLESEIVGKTNELPVVKKNLTTAPIAKQKTRALNKFTIPLENENYAKTGELPLFKADLADYFVCEAFKKGFDDRKARDELRRFIDYYVSAQAKWADWQAVCRNWLGRVRDTPPPRQTPRQERGNIHNAISKLFSEGQENASNPTQFSASGNGGGNQRLGNEGDIWSRGYDNFETIDGRGKRLVAIAA